MLYKMLTDRILNHLAVNTDMDMEHREIYAYSLERYISSFIDFIIFAVLAAALRIPAETIVFALFYGPLRKYAGGYHAKTRGQCLVLSILTLVSVVFLAKELALLNYWNILSIVLLIITGLLIFLLAPVDSENRRLPEEIKKQFRRNARLIFAADSLLLILGVIYLGSFRSYVMIGVLAVLLEGMILIPNKLTFRQRYAPR